MNGLGDYRVYYIVQFDPNIYIEYIFNSRFVDEVKGKTTNISYKKSRLVI